MADTNATIKRAVTCDFPDSVSKSVTFRLMKGFDVSNGEIFETGETYTLTLDANGTGTQQLPTPDNSGTTPGYWRVTTPDGHVHTITLPYSGSATTLASLIS